MVAEGRALPPLPRSLLGLGIGVGKGWEVVLKYKIRGRGGRRSYYSTEVGEGRGIPKRHILGTKHRNNNISPGRFWREKSFVSVAAIPLLLVSYSVERNCRFDCLQSDNRGTHTVALQGWSIDI